MGAKHGLYNLTNQAEMYRADSACDVYFDVFDQVAATNFAKTEEAKKKNLDALLNNVIPKTYKFLEKRLTSLNVKYVSGNNLCYADFCWASFMVTIASNANFPFSGELMAQLAMYPKISSISKPCRRLLTLTLKLDPKDHFDRV